MNLKKEVSVTEGYGQWAEGYDAQDNPMTAMVETHLPHFIRFNTGDSVVEVGCGTGRNLQALEQMGAGNLLGIDVSDAMLARAKEKFSAERASFLNLDICQGIPLENQSTDCVLFSLVLEHIETLKSAFLEASRILHENGRIHVFEIHPFLRLQGKAAHFMGEDGVEYQLPSYAHLIGDFFREALEAGLELVQIEEIMASGMEKSEKLARLGSVPVLLYLQFRRA